jgi:hypothetical protein
VGDGGHGHNCAEEGEGEGGVLIDGSEDIGILLPDIQSHRVSVVEEGSVCRPAKALLEESGFIVSSITYSVSTEPDGTVLWQSERAGDVVEGPEGEIPIKLIVSLNR